MMQSYKSSTLSRRRKRRRCIESLYCSSIFYFTLLIIGCLNFIPQGTTQHSDDVYIVKPTPALRFGKEELTTVLLVNNENHGRFINVRPEVGLLTSTARTFIQEGVTTEYATQVVGTTLDNGRVYAQYLKKSSRVLYNKSGVPLPSVVTSWVGESLHSDSTFLPQSHNDLFNADQPDWQAIDDHLLGDRHHSHHRDDFVRNTDFIGYLRTKTNYETRSIQNEKEKPLPGTVTISSFSSLYITNTKPVLNSIPQLGVLDENARKVAANKILPIGDLPTYTIKLNYESKPSDRGNYKRVDDNESVEGFDRSPKLIYKQLLQNNGQDMYSPLMPASRHLATVTYYGFADFTTVVGDSVIVFSPSTSTPNLNLKAHITSIKGEATLGAEGGLQQEPNISKVPITVAQDLIEPTLTERLPVETTLPRATTTYLSEDIETETSIQETITKVAEMESLEKEFTKIGLKTSEVMVQSSKREISSVNRQSTTTTSSVMLSRPSDEDILRIYNSLAKAKLKITEDIIASTTIESESTSSSTLENVIETSNVQIFGGATTIFFEDDPFANFVDATKSKTNLGTGKTKLEDITLVTTTEESLANQGLLLDKESSTILNIDEFTTESSLITSESAMNAISSSISTTSANINLITTQKSLQEENKTISDLSNVLIEEIDPNKDEIPNDCISTSQVFLTQLPKTVTNYEILAVTKDLSETVTETRLQIQPTFEIKEATKYYCIHSTATQPNQIESPSITSSVISENKNEQNNIFAHTSTSEITVTRKTVEEINQKADSAKTEENKTEERSVEITTQPPTDKKEENRESEEHEEEKENEKDEASGQQGEDNVDDDDEEIELIYKTLYTTYTYLTTFFHDDSTSVSSHTEVVTNVVTSTLGMTALPSLQHPSGTQLIANLDENEINPTSTISSTSSKYETTSKRYMVPSEVESIIRTDKDLYQESDNTIEKHETTQSVLESSETLATFYTTYTYYTTIFAEGETDIMSHTEIITNVEKTKPTANFDATKVSTITTTSSLLDNFETLEPVTEAKNTKNLILDTNGSFNNMMLLKPNIPDLGDLPAITLVTDVRSSSSSGNQQIINQYEKKINTNESNQQQHLSVLEDQVSSESNTDTDEIMPSATLLLQTSFTTFTYYTTMYSGDKTNVISRLETMTNTVTETVQPSKTIEFDGSATTVPVTYFTTFTFWTKLARDGQIATLSREETISNVITPTLVQRSEESSTTHIGNIESTSTTSIGQETEEHIVSTSSDTKPITITGDAISHTLQNVEYITKFLEPTTYYTTYTYYTTSYESDKTITDSRFETVTDILTPTVTLTNHIEYTTIAHDLILSSSAPSSTPLSSSIITTPLQSNTSEIETELILYDFKKIIDADGISTIFFTTEIKPTKNSEGEITEVISSTSSLLINEEKRKLETTETPLISQGQDGQTIKQYKTGLVRLIEGTRIANRTTTLYQSKVIGTVIDQRYAQIIESTSSFIFEKMKTQVTEDVHSSVNVNSDIMPASLQNVYATQSFVLNSGGGIKVEGSISDSSREEEGEVDLNIGKPNKEPEPEEESQTKANDERLRYPFQTKKPSLITPSLKTFSNRNRPQFAPKKNSNATIITRSDFTPTITATPALKTVNRFATSRRGSSSNAQAFATSSRRFGRPPKSSAQALQSSSLLSPSSRNRFASSSSSNTRGSFASSTRRLPGPSLSRSSLFSSAFPAGNSKLRIRPTASVGNLGEASSTLVNANSQEEKENSLAIDETVNDDNSNDNEEEYTTESIRRQNNPLLRLRRPLNRPQGFTPIRTQPNSPSNAVSVRRNPLIGRSRSNDGNSATTSTTTTTARTKPRTFQPPLISQNRRPRPKSSLFPPRNIFLGQKSTHTVDQNKDLSEETDDDEEDLNDNNDDSEYEDDDDEEDSEDENNRRRRSHVPIKASRKKREADPADQNRSNFRNRFRRPKLSSAAQAEEKSSDYDQAGSGETPVTTVSSTPNQRTRSRFGPRYTGHSFSSSTTATTSAATSTNLSKQKAIRPTRPTNSNGGRPQFTLREKDSSPSTSTQKGHTSAKRPAFRRPQPGGSATSRRLPSSTSTSSTSKRRLKVYPNSDTTTTARNSITTRNRSSSPSSSTSRSRSVGSSRDNTVRSRSRNNFNNNNNNNNNDDFVIDNSGTITVTHVIPTDVTIPIINGKLTEYKQVVTAKTSTEVLGPQQYTTTLGVNGVTQLVLTREDSSVNYNGATEVTQYVLHETSTTTITFTPTTIRGRKTSFSHVLPSTVYSVELVVSTLQPQISANAPLANILLSQLLLGNIGLPAANPLLGALGGLGTQPGLGTAIGGPQQVASPITEYKTHASTYVTTVFEGQSTVLPVTFQGKKILTTIFDTTAQTITATEFLTDTIVTTATIMAQAQPAVNSLLLQQLLFQQHLQQQQLQQPTPDTINPLNAILNSVPPQFLLGGDHLQELEVSNSIRGSGHGQTDPLNEDDDLAAGSSIDLDDITLQAQPQAHKNSRKKSRKNGKSHKRKQNTNVDNNPLESSVITLYVSGRRPGEFSTVLSTVQVRPDSTIYKRQVHSIDSIKDYFNDGSELINEYLSPPPEIVSLEGKATEENLVEYYTESSAQMPTQSLESIVGDVSQWYATQTITANALRSSHSTTSSTIIENKAFEINNLINSQSQYFFA